MSLLPFLMDIQPRRRRYADIFDLLEDERPFICRRPRLDLELSSRDLGSKIKVDKDKFQVNVDVQHFAPEEISVQTSDNYVVVEGKHEERKDDHGYVSRQFKRRYALPEGCSPSSVESKLSSDGILSIIAPRQLKNDVRSIPITHTGPVRRKIAEDEEEEQPMENGDNHQEEKSSQKKKSKR